MTFKEFQVWWRAFVAKVYGVQAPGGGTVTAPSVPTNLTVTQNIVGALSLSWTASVAGTYPVFGYQLYRNGLPLNATSSTTYTDTTMTQGAAYNYAVSSHDAQGNNSALSVGVDVVAASVAPNPPIWATVPAQSFSTNSAFTIELSAYVSSALALTYSIASGTLPTGLALNTVTGRVSGTVISGTSVSVTFRASDGTQATNSNSVVFTVVAPDTTAPPVPGSVSAVSSTGQIVFSWAAVTDTVVPNATTSGLKDYAVYRNGSLIQRVTTTSYTDSGLGQGVTNNYTVSARDNALNESAQSSIASATTPNADVLAPPTPLGLKAVAAIGQLTWTCDQTADIDQGINLAVGVASYDLELDGIIQNIAAPTQNKIPVFTLANIGGVTPAPTLAQNGVNWTITSAGTGIDGTADQCAFAYISVTGNGRLSMKVAGFSGSGGADFAPCGPMIRNSVAPGSVYATCYQWLNAVNKGFQGKIRDTLNGGRTALDYVAGDGSTEYYLEIEVIGTTVNFRYSTNGNNWQQFSTATLVNLNSVKLVGFVCTDLQASPVVLSAVLQGARWTPTADISYVQSTTKTSNVIARVRARDANGNVSAYSANYGATPLTTTAPGIKFNPGHYVLFDGNIYNSGPVTDRLSGIYSLITSIANEPTIKGVAVCLQWSVLEGPTAGVYNGFTIGNAGVQGGFTLVDQLLAACHSAGKKFMLITGFYQPGDFGTISFPDYILGSAYGTNVPYTDVNHGYRIGGLVVIPSGPFGGGEVTPAIWETPVADRFVALTTAYCGRYNSNPDMEMISPINNLALINAYQQFGYSVALTSPQVVRVYAAARAAAPNTALRIWLDYYASDTQSADLLDALAPYNIILGGNDVLPLEDITGDRAFNGTVRNDYRGIIPALANIVGLELQGKEGTNLPSALFNHVMNGSSALGIRAMRCQYFCWCSTDSGLDPPYAWTTGQLPFVRSIAGKVGNGRVDGTTFDPAVVKSTYPPTGYTGGVI